MTLKLGTANLHSACACIVVRRSSEIRLCDIQRQRYKDPSFVTNTLFILVTEKRKYLCFTIPREWLAVSGSTGLQSLERHFECQKIK